MNSPLYEWADRQINQCPRYEIGFTQLFSSGQYFLDSKAFDNYSEKLSVIREFQSSALKLFRASLRNDTDPKLLHWLINETPESLGINYHRNLEARHFSLPLFFRTDEAKPGRIVEIQCPGSLWGDLQLSYDYLVESKLISNGMSPAQKFSSQLASLLSDTPIVHHLMDNSSSPSSTRYFIEKTRPKVKYWGIDKDIFPRDCNFVRSHSFFGLCADNEFSSRLKKVGDGVTYDYPPHVLFDQKATIVLPFWSLTRDSFSDKIRNLFVFSTPLLPQGIELDDGSNVTIEEFSKWTRSKRAFFLKYAGSDVALNWGSKAVYRLSNISSNKCYKLLMDCLSQYEKGHIWLLQKEEKCDETINFINRDYKQQTQNLRAKYSAFYGPFACLGILAMHRSNYKVHGQADTIISYVESTTPN